MWALYTSGGRSKTNPLNPSLRSDGLWACLEKEEVGILRSDEGGEVGALRPGGEAVDVPCDQLQVLLGTEVRVGCPPHECRERVRRWGEAGATDMDMDVRAHTHIRAFPFSPGCLDLPHCH